MELTMYHCPVALCSMMSPSLIWYGVFSHVTTMAMV